MSTSSRGSARERQARKLLEAEGWAVTRGAGSKGAADLIALKAHKPLVGSYEVGLSHARVIQVKTDKASPWANFRPKERRELSALAAQTGGIAELWHWPARGKCRICFENEWPQTPNRKP